MFLGAFMDRKDSTSSMLNAFSTQGGKELEMRILNYDSKGHMNNLPQGELHPRSTAIG